MDSVGTIRERKVTNVERRGYLDRFGLERDLHWQARIASQILDAGDSESCFDAKGPPIVLGSDGHGPTGLLAGDRDDHLHFGTDFTGAVDSGTVDGLAEDEVDRRALGGHVDGTVRWGGTDHLGPTTVDICDAPKRAVVDVGVAREGVPHVRTVEVNPPSIWSIHLDPDDVPRFRVQAVNETSLGDANVLRHLRVREVLLQSCLGLRPVQDVRRLGGQRQHSTCRGGLLLRPLFSGNSPGQLDISGEAETRLGHRGRDRENLRAITAGLDGRATQGLDDFG